MKILILAVVESIQAKHDGCCCLIKFKGVYKGDSIEKIILKYKTSDKIQVCRGSSYLFEVGNVSVSSKILYGCIEMIKSY